MASIDYKNHKTAVTCKFKMVIILCKSIVVHKVGHASLVFFKLIFKSAKIMAALSSFRVRTVHKCVLKSTVHWTIHKSKLHTILQ